MEKEYCLLAKVDWYVTVLFVAEVHSDIYLAFITYHCQVNLSPKVSNVYVL